MAAPVIPALAQVAQRALASVGGQVFAIASGFQLTGHAGVTGAKPTITGLNAGIASASVVGTDAAGRITFTTTAGSIGAGAAANVLTVNFTVPFSAPPFVVANEGLNSTNGTAYLIPTSPQITTAAFFAIYTNGTALPGSTTFYVYYWVVGNVG